ncbi:MAG: hypothetical protein ISS83_01920 [Candidatus Pacebacteria bacterium]|nr:hypothetical protein [Candidatus Paceibacterota bacterium]
MAKQYTQEELLKLYENLPEELKRAMLGIDTSDHIWDICERYELYEVSKVAKLVGDVLLGILMPENFQTELEKSLNIEKETAQKVTQEINRFIFYPVRPILERLHEIKVAPEQKPTAKPIATEETEEKIETEKPIEQEKPSTPSSQDTYRESIE